MLRGCSTWTRLRWDRMPPTRSISPRRWRRTRRTCVSHLRIAALPNRRRHSSGIGRVERTSHSEGPDDDLAAKPRDLTGMHLRAHPQGDSRARPTCPTPVTSVDPTGDRRHQLRLWAIRHESANPPHHRLEAAKHPLRCPLRRNLVLANRRRHWCPLPTARPAVL